MARESGIGSVRGQSAVAGEEKDLDRNVICSPTLGYVWYDECCSSLRCREKRS